MKPMEMDIPKNPVIAVSYLWRKFMSRKYLAMSVLSWGVAALLIVFYLLPQISSTLEASQSLETSRQQLRTLQDKLDFIQTFQGDTFRSQENRVNTILPSYKPLLPLLNSLGQLSASQNVALTGIELNPGSISTASAESQQAAQRAAGGLAMLPVKLNVRGGIDNVNAFLNSLNTVTPVLELSDISLNPVSGGVEVLTPSAYEGGIGLVSYYAPIASVKTSVSQKLPTLSNADLDLIQELEQYTIYASLIVPLTNVKENLFEY